MRTILIIMLILVVAVIFANYWGESRCRTENGAWVKMNGGSHCVDKDFNEINIYD